MITTVKITDKDNLPCRYASGLEAFANGKEYVFRPGVNIIVGNNGCGKTTLIRMIADFMFCESSMLSKIPDAGYKFPPIFNGDDTLRDGIQIGCDYAGSVYRFIPNKDMDSDNVLESADMAGLYMSQSSSSTGEQHLESLGFLFNMAFGNRNCQFPIKKLTEIRQHTNPVWEKRLDFLLDYYRKNRIDATPEDFEFTFLLDEPDRNLDIDNIESLINILSFHKERTQLITVIHNPLVIWRLSDNKSVNFVEMTEGYVEKVRNVIDKGRRYGK